MTGFDYATAFTRNIGWLTEWEQDSLRGKRVAIAGLGGVGGLHLLTLTRLGVGGFSLAEFDHYDLVNFNRQVGATVASLGRPKLDVMAGLALDINPGLSLRRFPEGVQDQNLDRFLEGTDLFVDGFDFFELGMRRRTFRRCAELGIPAITAAPIGMGVAWLVFEPGGMSFDAYFGLEGRPEPEQFLRFLMGLAPGGWHRGYLVDPTRVDLERRTGPSTAASCQLCTGVVGVESVKLLLGRGGVWPAPHHQHFDPYLARFKRTRLRWGMAGPLQRAKLAVARRMYLRQRPPSNPQPEPGPTGPVGAILDAARWAPSGDNAQPWQFELAGEDRLLVRHRSEAGSNPYEYRGGEPSLLSLGMLIETARIAASAQGRRLEYEVQSQCDGDLVVALTLSADSEVTTDPLESVIRSRSVVRGALKRRALSEREKTALGAALGPGLSMRWLEGPARWQVARLSAIVSDIRLRAPELFEVHRRVVDWRPGHSETGMPSSALGLGRPTLALMQWAMKRWARVHWMNRLAGTQLATAQLDLLPGVRCAAYVAVARTPSFGAWDTAGKIRAGAALQRFWLTATRLELALQPATGLLLVAEAARDPAGLAADQAVRRRVERAGPRIDAALGSGDAAPLFVARIGARPPGLPRARSVRRPLADLLVQHASP